MITGLQLSHLNVATMPHVVEKFQEGTKKKNLKLVNQHILIQINNLSVFLKEGKHSETRHLTPETPAELKIPKYLIPIQSAALSPRGRLYGLNGTFKLAALASGFEIVGAGGGEKYHWSKKLQTGSPTSLKQPTSSQQTRFGQTKDAVHFQEDSQQGLLLRGRCVGAD